jgi:hypothetical protein
MAKVTTTNSDAVSSSVTQLASQSMPTQTNKRMRVSNNDNDLLVAPLTSDVGARELLAQNQIEERVTQNVAEIQSQTGAPHPPPADATTVNQYRPGTALATGLGTFPKEVVWHIRSFLLGGGQSSLPVGHDRRVAVSSRSRNYACVMMMEYCGILDLFLDLQEIVRQFADADTFNIAPDISENASEMVEKAWSGWSLGEIIALMDDSDNDGHENRPHNSDGEAEINTNITLVDAVQNIQPFLSSICIDYVNTVRANMIRIGVNWNNDRFKRDVFRAMGELKVLQFGSFDIKDFDNIQAALTLDRDGYLATHTLPRAAQNAMFIIHRFCLRFVSCSNSLMLRTNSKIANDTTTDANQELPPQYYDESVSLVPHWPGCVDVNNSAEHNHWARHFSVAPEGYYDDYDEDMFDGSWLTPQMAKNLHCQAFNMAQLHLEDTIDEPWYTGKLPKIATPFYKKSPMWRKAFVECHMRIAARLSKGLDPSPNCTGEEMALHNIINMAEADDDYEVDESLVKFKNDQNFSLLRENVVEDEDVLMLFEDGDNGHSGGIFGNNNDEVDRYTPGPLLTNILWGDAGKIARVANLHPADWFIPFRINNYRNHL